MRTLRLELKDLSSLESRVLNDMCICSKNLYNVALYEVKKTFRETGKNLPYAKIDKWAREEKPKHYRKLSSVNAQGTLSKLGDDYASYFGLLKKKDLHFFPKPPKYKKESGLFNLFFNDRAFQVQEGRLRLSLSKYHKNKFRLEEGYLFLPITSFVTEKDISVVEVVPLGYGRFELHVKYEEVKPASVQESQPEKIMALDLGINNFCTAVTSDGDAFILSGLELKSVNMQWNKNKARLQSEMDLEKERWPWERLREESQCSTLKRNRRIQDILHKLSYNLVNYAHEHGVTDIVSGYNEGWKHKVNIGGINNQKFVCIPHRRFLDYVKYKAENLGIGFTLQEESYTSKCDSLALETIERHEKYMGRRKHRGLFQSSTNVALNADVNGSLNILRKKRWPNKGKIKGKDESLAIAEIVSMGRVFRPRKTTWGLSPCSPKLSFKEACINMPVSLDAGI